ncbi:MAG: hypothetical protein KME45_06285 [Stenomitos rutilans HA7619-LM2]|jgi:hypothetical protein|nr:hypothetical protein [Stenomitos rutilans HA7619-LM2]
MGNGSRVYLAPFRCKGWFLFASVLLLSTGCSRLLQGKPSQDINLKFAVDNRLPGIYAIAGKTNLPEKTQIMVAAIRYLYPATIAAKNFNPNPTYAVLAYQPVEVNRGTWDTTLNLWETGTDGRFQESWQLDQTKLNLTVAPSNEVVFLATLAPVDRSDQLKQLENQLAKQNIQLSRKLVHGTADGQQYLQVSQTLAIALPTGNTTPPSIRPEDINGGWGNRFLIPLEPQNPIKLELPKERRTNAPVTAEEFFR